MNRIGARPENLRLELTESMLSHNVDDTVAKMSELRSHGVRFSLDDFGTGYSSLAYLKQLPISRLKIDRAFVKDILVDAASGAIAQTIISLGRALDLSVIAEGVETEEQTGISSQAWAAIPTRDTCSAARFRLAEFERFLDEFANKHHGDGRNPAASCGHFARNLMGRKAANIALPAYATLQVGGPRFCPNFSRGVPGTAPTSADAADFRPFPQIHFAEHHHPTARRPDLRQPV